MKNSCFLILESYFLLGPSRKINDPTIFKVDGEIILKLTYFIV